MYSCFHRFYMLESKHFYWKSLKINLFFFVELLLNIHVPFSILMEPNYTNLGKDFPHFLLIKHKFHHNFHFPCEKFFTFSPFARTARKKCDKKRLFVYFILKNNHMKAARQTIRLNCVPKLPIETVHIFQSAITVVNVEYVFRNVLKINLNLFIKISSVVFGSDQVFVIITYVLLFSRHACKFEKCRLHTINSFVFCSRSCWTWFKYHYHHISFFYRARRCHLKRKFTEKVCRNKIQVFINPKKIQCFKSGIRNID